MTSSTFKTALALAGVVLLGSCGAQEGASDAVNAQEQRGLVLGGELRSAGDRMQRVVGKWESSPGVIPGERSIFLRLNLAADETYILEARGIENGTPTVYASSRGSLSWDEKGMLSGSGSAPPRIIAEMTSWTASFPGPGEMMITTPRGEKIPLAYRGR